MNNVASETQGSLPPLDRSQHVHLVGRTALARTARSRLLATTPDAAVRLVEAAVGA